MHLSPVLTSSRRGPASSSSAQICTLGEESYGVRQAMLASEHHHASRPLALPRLSVRMVVPSMKPHYYSPLSASSAGEFSQHGCQGRISHGLVSEFRPSCMQPCKACALKGPPCRVSILERGASKYKNVFCRKRAFSNGQQALCHEITCSRQQAPFHEFTCKRQQAHSNEFACNSQLAGVSDPLQPTMWALPDIDCEIWDSGLLDHLPQEEAMDPVSKLIYQHALHRNVHWWRLPLFSGGAPQSLTSPRHTCYSLSPQHTSYSLVHRGYTKILLRPKKSRGLISPPFMHTVVNNIVATLCELGGWFHHMGNEYGVSLLLVLVLGYWIQGFRCFPWLAVSYHLKDSLQIDPAMLQFLQSTASLPMVVKPLYGIISDAVYINGARRMPYLKIAGMLQLCSWFIVASNPSIRSSALPLMGILVVSNVGAAIAEVVNDALVAESVQKERGHSKGELQVFVWLALATGGLMGNLSGGLALSRMNSETMFYVFAALTAMHLVVSGVVKEKVFGFSVARQSMKNVGRAIGILETVQSQAVKLLELVSREEIRRPLLWFFASYAVIPTLAGSLFFYQTQHLKISPTCLGLGKVIGQMGLLAGSLFYNCYLKQSSPRNVLRAVQYLLSVCMLSDLLLVSRMNLRLGIPDQFFVLGASAFVEAIAQFKLLPFTVLLTQLCPAGSEGSLLAFFMSCHCLASILSGYLGTFLASFLHLSATNFAGLSMGILVQSMAALIPLMWISCIPCTSNKSFIALDAKEGFASRKKLLVAAD